MKDLLQILKQQNKEQDFDAIRVGLASPERFVLGLLVKLKSQKQSTIEPLSQKEKVYFVLRSLAQ